MFKQPVLYCYVILHVVFEKTKQIYSIISLQGHTCEPTPWSRNVLTTVYWKYIIIDIDSVPRGYTALC